MSDIIITVDELGRQTGTADKMQAHVDGLLHRAFSIFIFNTAGELLLQQRADDKYHSGGKWTNSCCSHPRQGEEILSAAHRRLQEEMGFDCQINEVFTFRYCETLENGLIENEFDHVFFGVSDVEPIINPAEVKAFTYTNMDLLNRDLQNHPDNYTVWLNICFKQVVEEFNKRINNERSAN